MDYFMERISVVSREIDAYNINMDVQTLYIKTN